MKQHITVEQLNELNPKGKKKLRKWWKPTESDVIDRGCINWIDEENEVIHFYNFSFDKAWECDFDQAYPLLSIGQMIQFLGRDWVNNIYYYPTTDTGIEPLGGKSGKDWLCNNLWDLVKEKLNA